MKSISKLMLLGSSLYLVLGCATVDRLFESKEETPKPIKAAGATDTDASGEVTPVVEAAAEALPLARRIVEVPPGRLEPLTVWSPLER